MKESFNTLKREVIMVKYTDFTSRITDNGIEMHFCYNQKFKTNLVQLNILQPLREETASMNALLPYVLYRGSESYNTSRDFEIRLDELYGADLNLSVLKRGENHIIRFSLEINNEKYLPDKAPLLEEGLDLIYELLLNPLFKAKYVEQEKELLKNEIASLKNDKFSYAIERCYQEMCQGEAFSIYKLGTIDRLKETKREDLYNYYQQLLKDSYLSFFIIGDMEEQRVYNQVNRIFNFEHKKVEYKNRTEILTDIKKVNEKVEKMQVQQGKLSLGFRTGITKKDNLYPALLLYNGILGGFPHSKLFQNVREKASLAYYAYSQVESTKGLLLISSGIDPLNYQKAREIIIKQVQKLAQGEFNDEEFEWTKRGLINQYKSSADNIGAIAAHYLLGLVNERRESIAGMIKRLEAVKKDEIVEVARKIKLDTVYFLDKKVKEQ